MDTIYELAKNHLGITLGAYYEVEYRNHTLKVRDGDKRVKPKNVKGGAKRFLDEMKKRVDSDPNARQSVSEESPWDDDMYIVVAVDHLGDGFEIYMG